MRNKITESYQWIYLGSNPGRQLVMIAQLGDRQAEDLEVTSSILVHDTY